MWLASVAMRNRRGQIVPVSDWAYPERQRAETYIDRALSGLGNPRRERQFRMVATLCRHRALSDAEARSLPESFYTEPAHDLAGGPVAIEWEHGIPHVLSTEPCAKPGRQPFPGAESHRLWLPVDCGECPSCLARSACAGRLMRRPEGA